MHRFWRTVFYWRFLLNYWGFVRRFLSCLFASCLCDFLLGSGVNWRLHFTFQGSLLVRFADGLSSLRKRWFGFCRLFCVLHVVSYSRDSDTSGSWPSRGCGRTPAHAHGTRHTVCALMAERTTWPRRSCTNQTVKTLHISKSRGKAVLISKGDYHRMFCME